MNNNLPYREYVANNGRPHIEFTYLDQNNRFGKHYDTTRLIVDTTPEMVEGRPIYNAAVSWYGSSDAQFLNSEYRGRIDDFSYIKVGLDIEKLKSGDQEYATWLFEGIEANRNGKQAHVEGLLEQNRVEGYLQRGLKETPEVPCGNYVGQVERTGNGKYGKTFSVSVGKACHDSQYMQVQRAKARQEELKAKESQKSYLEGKIMRLQEEYNQL